LRLWHVDWNVVRQRRSAYNGRATIRLDTRRQRQHNLRRHHNHG